ncbi:aspartate kinase [bacterium]|nr:aspartate kinase [bacterium]
MPAGPIVVRKYGGSSLADIARLRAVARDLRAARDAGQRLVVVVSAMGDTTDRLSAQAHEANPEPPRRELDMLLTVGERISMSLLCMALAAEGVPATSLTGSQAGIITDASHTDARILAVRPIRIPEALASGKVVVVAGFQGVCGETKEITTLGRGGSDTTAVALAHALGAERCEILKDVPGVMTADPKLVPTARRIERLDAAAMQRLADAGCGVVHGKAVEYARQHGVPLFVGSSFEPGPGTVVDPPAAPAVEATPDRFEPLAVTIGRGQARLEIVARGPAAATQAAALAADATRAGPLTAQWMSTGARWHWEAWGPQAHLDPVAAAARAAQAATAGTLEIDWTPGQAVITVVGRRPENWAAGLRALAATFLAADLGEAPVRSDGDALRILVPDARAAAAATTLHDRLLGS